MRATLNKLKLYLWVGAGLFFSVLMFRITWPYFSFRYDVDFLLTKQNILHVSIWRLAFYTHISSSLLVLFLGVLQFPRSIIVNRPKVHRLFGKIYVILVLFLSAPSGFVMALYANGGIPAQLSFAIISILWWYFTFKAYRLILKRDLDRHQAFMYRSFALTLSAITLRSYVFLLPHFIHINGKDMYILVAWLSWIPNLIVAEWLIHLRKRISTFMEPADRQE